MVRLGCAAFLAGTGEGARRCQTRSRLRAALLTHPYRHPPPSTLPRYGGRACDGAACLAATQASPDRHWRFQASPQFPRPASDRLPELGDDLLDRPPSPRHDSPLSCPGLTLLLD